MGAKINSRYYLRPEYCQNFGTINIYFTSTFIFTSLLNE